MSGAGDRAQDVGRSHKAQRRGGLAPETAAVLARYRGAMRRELSAILDELEPVEMVQTSIDGSADRPIALGITARRERWELAMRLGRELNGAIDPEEPAPASKAAAGGGRPPRLSVRQRRQLGAD